MQVRHSAVHPKYSDNTSDHTYQAAQFQLMNAGSEILFSVRGVTWNLMDRCLSQSTTGLGFSNNPWDMDESVDEYLHRKEKQLSKLLNVLTSNDQGPKDFALLQEIDFFYRSPINASEQELHRYEEMKQDFLSRLNQYGYAMTMTEYIYGVNQQPLAIIYNKNTLELEQGTQRGTLRSEKDVHRGFEAKFKHKDSGQRLTLASLHLDYAEDYSETIPAYQSTKVAMNEFTIMGGDTNHPPNHKITGLINNWNNITNIDLDKSGSGLTLSGSHEGLDNVQKCYDGFFANPTEKTRVVIAEEKAEVFEIAADSEIRVRPLDPRNEYRNYAVHQSPQGAAWSRGAVEKKELGLDTSITKSGVLFARSKPGQSIQIFKSRRGGIGVRFPNGMIRDGFVKELGQGTINSDAPHKIIGEGECPYTYPRNADTAYFPYYMTDDGRYAVVFPNSEMRDRFSELLGLEKSQKAEAAADGPTLVFNSDVVRRLEKSSSSITVSQGREMRAIAEAIEDKGIINPRTPKG